MKTSANLQHRHPGIWQTSVAKRPSVKQYRCHRGEGLLKVMPQLQQMAQQQGWILLINAPECDWSAFVRQAGVDSSRILRVRCDDELEAMLALEQALTGGTCASVLAWVPTLDHRDKRRLELIQKRAHCPAFLFHKDNQWSDSLAVAVH